MDSEKADRHKCCIEISITPHQSSLHSAVTDATKPSRSNSLQGRLTLPKFCCSSPLTTTDANSSGIDLSLVDIKPTQVKKIPVSISNGRSNPHSQFQLSIKPQIRCPLVHVHVHVATCQAKVDVCNTTSSQLPNSRSVLSNGSTSCSPKANNLTVYFHPVIPENVQKHSINLVTWNINKGSVPKGGSTAGFAGVRHYLMDRFYSAQHPLFSCLQEIDSMALSGITNYSCQLGGKQLKEAGVGCPIDSQIKHINPPPKGGKCHYNDVTNERFYGSIIYINDVHKFMLVSYHGKYYQMKEENRKIEILNFFEQMCVVADIHKMTVIIGGDFNLDIGQWKTEAEEKFKGRVFVAVKYEKGPRRRYSNVIDTFAVVYPNCPSTEYTICILGNPTPVSFENCSTPISTTNTTFTPTSNSTINFIASCSFTPPSSNTHTSYANTCTTNPPVNNTTALQAVVLCDEQCIQRIAGTPQHARCLFNLMDHDPVVVTVSLYTL